VPVADARIEIAVRELDELLLLAQGGIESLRSIQAAAIG
jgi:hypothetical protein